ncbi:MAG: helix-turn-helix domain-containing protein [Sulfitobacter sp.]
MSEFRGGAQCSGLPPTCARGHRPDGPKANHALTFKLDHSSGAAQRRVIEDMLNAKIPVREIATEIGRHVSTVYRDIKRNGYTDDELPELNGYYGAVTQKPAAQRRARRRKLVRLAGLRKAVIKQLKEGWSPEQINGLQIDQRDNLTTKVRSMFFLRVIVRTNHAMGPLRRPRFRRTKLGNARVAH